MNLTSVKYKDSCIYISLKCSQNELDGRDVESFLRKFRNIYVVYKIKAFDRQVRNTILIKRKDLFIAGNDITLNFKLSHLHHPEESQIEIGTLKFNFHEDKSEVLSINKTYYFREIRSIAPIAFGKKELRKNKNNTLENKTFYVLEERYFNRYKDTKPSNSSTSSKFSRNSKSLRPTKSSRPNKLKESLTSQKKELNPQSNKFKEDSIAADSSTVIEETTPISTVVSEVESEIESKLDLETMKLDKDIRQLCYVTIDLLLSNLPLPEFSNEHSASNAMVRSIHRYINTELLQNEHEGGEST